MTPTKTSLLIAGWICLAVLRSQFSAKATPSAPPASAPISYKVTEMGPNHRVYSQTTWETNEQGFVIGRESSYKELGDGLNYRKDGIWHEAAENIAIQATGGAVASEGQHQVFFPGDIYSENFELTMPDSKRLVSRPLGLAFSDGVKTTLIAELKPGSEGQLLPNHNQVLYADICSGCKLDLLCSYRRASYESDLIIRQQLPPPEDYGFSSDSAVRIQWWTEFFSPPDPQKLNSTASEEPDEEILDFGAMRMPRGKAFLLGATAESQVEIPVSKHWVALEGRTFLVEEIPLNIVKPQLDTLPQSASNGARPPGGDKVRQLAGGRIVLPAARGSSHSHKPIRFAKEDSRSSPGFTLDYLVVLNSGQTNFVFQGDETFFLSSDITLSGTNTVFEGGAVLKFASNVTMRVTTPVTWNASMFRPVQFVASDDNSVGDTVSGSSGNPGQGYYATRALFFDANSAATNLIIQYLRVANAQTAIAINGRSGHALSHVQLVTCAAGLSLTNADTSLRNALMDHVLTNFTGSTATGRVEHLTSDTAIWLNSNIGSSLLLTNSLLAGVTNTGTYTAQNVTTVSSGAGVFAAVGAGYHYLAGVSTNRNAGTTNINAALAADLRRMTTYPPLVYSNVSITSPATWDAVVQRDTDVPDIGFHYAPIDYLASQVDVTSTLLVTNGAVIAAHNGTLFKVHTGLSVLGQGTADNLNRITVYSMVQEQPLLLGSSVTGLFDTTAAGSPAPSLQLRFTDVSVPAAGPSGPCFFISSSNAPLNQLTLKDCWLRGATLFIAQTNTFNTTVALTNNLFERANVAIARDGDSTLSTTVFLWNNLFFRGNLALTYNLNPFTGGSYPSWMAYDNALDGVNLSESGNIQTNILNGNNGYVNTSPQLTNGTSNVILSAFAYTNSWLGSYYQQSAGLINQGSRTADLASLYHYTTVASQVKETNSIVDIGFHYVAVDGTGKPIDTDGDGIADYLEDVNGNGNGSDDPTSWQIYNSPNGLTGTAALQVFTPLK